VIYRATLDRYANKDTARLTRPFRLDRELIYLKATNGHRDEIVAPCDFFIRST